MTKSPAESTFLDLMDYSDNENRVEISRMLNNDGLDLIIVNTIQYSLEAIYYLVGWALFLGYLVVSNGVGGFHVQLRILLICLITGMMGAGLCRALLAPIRIVYAHDIPIPWLVVYDYWARVFHLCFVMLIDTSIFATSLERLVAAYHVNSYEQMATGKLAISVTWFVHLGSNVLIDYFLYLSKPDPYNPKYIYVSFVVMASNVLGLVVGVSVVDLAALLVAFRHSKLSLKAKDRHLSKSFQCRENLRVVNVVVPIYLLLFFTRCCQLLSTALFTYFGIQVFRAFWTRVILHLYNQSLGLCVLFTAFLLIWLQPPIRKRLFKVCVRRQAPIGDPEVEKARETNYYFQNLQKIWVLP